MVRACGCVDLWVVTDEVWRARRDGEELISEGCVYHMCAQVGIQV